MNDISEQISNTIIEPSSISASAANISDNLENSSNSFFDWIKNISLTTWVLILLILSFLGFNIFVYLAKGTQDVTNIFGPLVQKIAGLFVGVTGQVVNVSAEGAKAVVNTSAQVADTGLGAVQNVASKTTNTNINANANAHIDNTTQNNIHDVAQANTLNRALNSSTSQKQQRNGEDYHADESTSSIQQGAPKSGWCYIGEDRGFRSCSEVGPNDSCMSGDIFPTHEICVNPNLRQ